ncbi:MAG TPA: hypothetical protein VGF17_13485, partial [Phytomonospora sp.]
MPSQNRLDLSKPLDFHSMRDASTLVAQQFTDVLTSAQVMPDGKDTARINAASGAINVTVPEGTDENIGIVYRAIKTDSTGNAAGLACPSGQTLPDASTSLTTTNQGGEVALKWDGTYWRNANPGSGASGPLSVSTLTVSGAASLNGGASVTGGLTVVNTGLTISAGGLRITAGTTVMPLPTHADEAAAVTA